MPLLIAILTMPSNLLERLIKGAFRGKRNFQMIQIINTMYLNKFGLDSNKKIIAYYRIYSAFGGQGSQAARSANAIQQEFGRNPNRVNGEALRYVGN